LRGVLDAGGIGLTSICGGPALESIALAHGLAYVPVVDGGEELARRRALRPKREMHLSDAARSLAADFAGARADIADRRKRGETSVRRVVLPQKNLQQAALTAVVPAQVTLYHRGTLRGGQSLHNVGNIVVLGDVNPGAELVASGDILVFGALRGVAHAGAQGDATAKVYALELAATQLRIATFIAAEAGRRRTSAVRPEAAYVRDERIAVAPYDKIDEILGAPASRGDGN
jgi:septum site-determining protein MinC